MGYRKSIDMGALEAPAQGNWVLIGTKRFNNESPAGVTWDISGCTKFMVDAQITAMPANYISLVFDGDTGANYQRTQISAQDTVTGGQVADTGIIIDSWPGATYSNTVFDKRTKCGKADMLAQNAGSTQINMSFGYRYSGAGAMNTLGFNATALITGTISVYKWVEASIPAEVVSYELVKEWNLNNQTLDESIPWDGDVDDALYITANLGTGTAASLLLALNGDVTADNYQLCQTYAAGSTPSAYVGTNAGLRIGSFGDGAFAETTIALRSGQKRTSLMTIGRSNLVAVTSTQWLNTADRVTSMRIYSSKDITGIVRLYKQARTRLITTNPNLNTLWHKYIDANTVQMQPGEIEINGAVMKVQKATNVTLSGNLKAGLAEAANTMYYMYAVRTPGKAELTYLFDTQAPLMDRYGNTVASFEDCDAAHAWFHPTLGVNYRWVGQVLNDASSNLAAYDKCMPGYWESAYTSIPGTSIQSLQHAYGKTNFNARMLFKSALTDTMAHERMEFFVQSTTQYGVMLGSHDNTGVAVKSPTSVVMNAAGSNVFMHNGTWRSTGYYKLIITEN